MSQLHERLRTIQHFAPHKFCPLAVQYLHVHLSNFPTQRSAKISQQIRAEAISLLDIICLLTQLGQLLRNNKTGVVLICFGATKKHNYGIIEFNNARYWWTVTFKNNITQLLKQFRQHLWNEERSVKVECSFTKILPNYLSIQCIRGISLFHLQLEWSPLQSRWPIKPFMLVIRSIPLKI